MEASVPLEALDLVLPAQHSETPHLLVVSVQVRRHLHPVTIYDSFVERLEMHLEQ